MLEQERAETAALVEKHSKEMMTLIQEKRAQYIDQNEEFEGPIGNGHTEDANVQKVISMNFFKSRPTFYIFSILAQTLL